MLEAAIGDNGSGLRSSTSRQSFLHALVGRLSSKTSASKPQVSSPNKSKDRTTSRNHSENLAPSIYPPKKPGAFWNVAVSNWKQVVVLNAKSRAQGLNDGDHAFTTPNAENINRLFDQTISLKDVTATWYWRGRSRDSSTAELRKFIKQRGEIVHRVSAARRVLLADAEKRRDFIGRLGKKTDQSVARYLQGITGQPPW